MQVLVVPDQVVADVHTVRDCKAMSAEQEEA